jgi:hypothetical protein
MGRMCSDPEAHLAGMLAFAQTKLALKPEQTDAWNKFAADMKAAIEPMKTNCAQVAETRGGQPSSQETPAPLPLPERLNQQVATVTAHAAVTQGVAKAIATLYPSLSPEQQKIADTLHFPGMGPRHHGPEGHRGMKGMRN